MMPQSGRLLTSPCGDYRQVFGQSAARSRDGDRRECEFLGSTWAASFHGLVLNDRPSQAVAVFRPGGSFATFPFPGRVGWSTLDSPPRTGVHWFQKRKHPIRLAGGAGCLGERVPRAMVSRGGGSSRLRVKDSTVNRACQQARSVRLVQVRQALRIRPRDVGARRGAPGLVLSVTIQQTWGLLCR